MLRDLDRAVARNGYPSRSHVISLLLSEFLTDKRAEQPDVVVFGTISLLYYNNVFDLPRQLADMQYHYIDEVISSLHVQLVRSQTMEMILVQGPARKLQEIVDELTKLRGVISGALQLVGAVIPPLHQASEPITHKVAGYGGSVQDL